MESLPDLYPLTSLQIGDIKSYLSRTFLYFAPSSHKFYIFVDNQSWWKSKDSRANCIREFMITQCRESPFINTKVLQKCPSFGYKSSNNNQFCKWLPIVNIASVRERALFAMLSLYKALHGFIVFEASWKDVRGINYLNELQSDTSLALEVKFLKKWEFSGIEQALSCIPLWFSGTTAEIQTLWRNLSFLQSKVSLYSPRGGKTASPKKLLRNESRVKNCSEDVFFDVKEYPTDTNDNFGIHSNMEENVKENLQDYNVEPVGHTSDTNNKFSIVQKQPMQDQTKENLWEDVNIEPIRCKGTLLLLRFDDRDLPFKLKQVITSDLKLLTLLEAGLPSWVIFLQSYPLFNRVYRPWMRPLLKILYAIISSITVIIGFYDLYKNVPLLRAAASHLYWPFFKQIEAWDMISRIKYLGTMLFLHNFEKAVEWFILKTRVTGLIMSLIRRFLIPPLLYLLQIIKPVWNLFYEIGKQTYWIIMAVLRPLYNLLLNFLDILFSPLEILYLMILNLVKFICSFFGFAWGLLLVPSRGCVLLAKYIASIILDIYNMLTGTFKMFNNSKGMLINLAHSKPSTSNISIWRSLWTDLFSKVFLSLKKVICGIITFIASCSRHRLSIYNYSKAAIQQSPHLLRVAPLYFTYRSVPRLESPRKMQVIVKKQCYRWK